MTNAFGVVVDNASVRLAAVEGVPETVRSVDEIESKLGPLMIDSREILRSLLAA